MFFSMRPVHGEEGWHIKLPRERGREEKRREERRGEERRGEERRGEERR